MIADWEKSLKLLWLIVETHVLVKYVDAFSHKQNNKNFRKTIVDIAKIHVILFQKYITYNF